MIVDPPKPLNLPQLQAELAAAGVQVPALGSHGSPSADVFTYDGGGAATDLPPQAAPIVAAHVASNPARTAVINLAQSAVGAQLGTLTANQQRALLACLLYEAGAVDANLVVQPLGGWVW